MQSCRGRDLGLGRLGFGFRLRVEIFGVSSFRCRGQGSKIMCTTCEEGLLVLFDWVQG